MYSLDTESVTRYWLPYGHATIDSMAVDGKDAWFYFSDFAEKHLGRITMGQTAPEFHEYDLDIHLPLFVGHPQTPRLSREAQMEAMLKERWTDISQGIAAKDGNVWYGEAAVRWRLEEPEKSLSAHGEPVTWAICRLHAATGRITKYVFPEPDMTPRSHVGYRMSTDLEGRRLGGATYANSVWIFDTRTRQLKRFVLGGILEDRIKHPDGSEQVLREPELWLKDVALTNDGRRCWAVDCALRSGQGALYELNIEEESILRHSVSGFGIDVPGSYGGARKTRLDAVSLGPDGKVWLTCNVDCYQSSSEQQRVNPYPVPYGFVISFDPRTSEATSYRLWGGIGHVGGIVVTSKGSVWYGFESHNRWGLTNLGDDSQGKSVNSHPEEVKAVGVLESEVAESDGGEAVCRKLDLLTEPPVRRRIQEGNISLELGGDKGIVRKLAEDTDGHIWFSTWGEGSIEVLTPPHS